MPNRRLRFAAVVAVVGGLAVPSAASAGPFAPVGFLVGEYKSETVQPLSADKSSFALAAYDIDGYENNQTVAGTLAGAPFVGFLASHDYDRASDHVTYNLYGSADPTGAAPPLPVAMTFNVEIDRVAETRKVSVSGTVGGSPVVGYTRTFTVPTGYQLVP